MANKQRGETTVEIGRKKFTFCLTLGALAELEDVLGVTTPGELDEIIQMPTYRQLLTMTHTLINFRKDQELITVDAIEGSDLTWQRAFTGIISAVAAGQEATEGNAKEPETTDT